MGIFLKRCKYTLMQHCMILVIQLYYVRMHQDNNDLPRKNSFFIRVIVTLSFLKSSTRLSKAASLTILWATTKKMMIIG